MGLLVALGMGVCAPLARATPPYPWLRTAAQAAPAAPAVPNTLAERIAPPPGFRRVAEAPGGFGAWLRGLPVKPGRPPVYLFDGRAKMNQQAHHVVLDVDVGTRDRQQCADAVMRLRAEYLHASGADATICFRFTDGTKAPYASFRDGFRPQPRGRTIAFTRQASPDGSYATFRRYLDVVFTYAGSFSLARELAPVPDPRAVMAGDVFIQGGFPGHAVIVVDVAQDQAGQRAVLLAQSYMPAQEIHVLRNPAKANSANPPSNDDPWYVISGDQTLTTPEWTFAPGSLRRFSAEGCPPLPARRR